MAQQKPIIGITLGDPAGIGSEITAKMLTQNNDYVLDRCIPLIIGDTKVFQQGLEMIGSDLEFKILDQSNESAFENLLPGNVYMYNLDNISLSDYTFGQVSAEAGRASGEYIEKAVELALAGKIDAIVTNPIHKKAFELGGYGKKYPGHTEMLADLTATTDYSMMLASGNLRVFHVTTHVSLLDAVTKYIKKPRILDVIKLANQTCQQLGIEKPAIGVAGLNAHAGDEGLFGDEEAKEIYPAVKDAQLLGIKADGPVPPDTVFSKALGGMYDAVVAMYHDQGHIPIKLAGFVYDSNSNKWNMKGVNVTLGLPIIRTSVDHGTAFGKAGQGRADHNSLLEALNYAVKMAEVKKLNPGI